MTLPGSTFDCGSRMYSFLLFKLYYLAVLLLVILSGRLFNCGSSWHSFQFCIFPRSPLEFNTLFLLWYSLAVLLTSILVPKSKLLPKNAVRPEESQ